MAVDRAESWSVCSVYILLTIGPGHGLPMTSKREDLLSLVDPELAPTKAPVTYLRPTGLAVVRGLIRSCRPKQWSKNVLLFFGLIFALKLTDPALVGRAFLGFLVFCAASSGVYLINDVADVEK